MVDDVWSISEIQPLLAESPCSRFLFTTRDQSIGRFVGARDYKANLLDPAQARELLALWSAVLLNCLTWPTIIAECGHMPLAISIVGALLRGADSVLWQDMLDLLRKADLKAIEDQLPEGQGKLF